MTTDEPHDDDHEEHGEDGGHDHDGEPSSGSGSPRGHRPVSWTNRLILGFTVLVLLVAGWFIATAFLPTWWADRVGQVSDGSTPAGVFAGLTCGVVFTAVPLLLVRRAVRRRARWGARLAFLVLAAIAAVPNLTTLGVVLGNGSAAHTAERIMDDDAPGFRGATAVGAVAGAIGVFVFWSLLSSRRRRRRELSELRAELRRRELEEAEASDEEG